MAQGAGGGPKTPAGRRRSAFNALSHGLTSLAPVLPNIEEEGAWLEFRQRIVEDIAPVGALEEEFAQNIAVWLWVRRRIDRYTQECLKAAQSNIREDLLVLRLYDGVDRYEDAESIPPEVHERHREIVERWARQRVVPDASQVDRIVKY